ncbi:MAG: hypothetical protein GKR89_21910 [Candidatus Latescibacteria bacterium]|nr:hypothetical protein [Candidatus Latescibacterota bacterium]
MTGKVLLFGLCLSICWFGPALALDQVTLGEGGQLDWRAEGSSILEVIDTQHRSPLDPNNLIIGNAPGDLVEFDSEQFVGGLLPLRIVQGANIAVGTVARGGSIQSPNVFDFSGLFSKLDLKNALEELLSDSPGGELDAYERKNLNALGNLVILNLGARFGVNRIRFYPRNSGAVDSTVQVSPSTPFQNDFLKAFEVFTNDGLNLTRAGNQIWDPLVAETENQQSVVDIPIEPPRYVQSVRLRATSPIAFEIDEFEVFGVGYLATATYVSDIFDAGQPAVWSTLRWVEEALGDAQFSRAQVRTRTGSDATPFVFTRVLQGKRDAEEVTTSLANPDEELGLEEYRNLYGGTALLDAQGRAWEGGPVKDDLVNWSPYSPPYQVAVGEGGEGAVTTEVPIVSPNPRRYFQFQISFESSDLESARLIRSLGFELLTPPFADELVGEIYPRQVPVSQATSFTYAVRPTMGTTGLRGFDTIEISTPIQIEAVEGIEIFAAEGALIGQHAFAGLADTVAVDGFRIAQVTPRKFAVQFPLVEEDGVLVQVRFRTSVLTYSTNFAAFARLESEPGASQPILAGDAASLAADDDPNFSGTAVLSPTVLGGRLLDEVELVPNPFSPNGDGVNDITGLNYNLLSLSAPRLVEIQVYDLGGRQVRTVHSGTEANGRYEDKSWDGRDDQGNLVPPGTYIVRLSVDGDDRQEERMRPVAVVY